MAINGAGHAFVPGSFSSDTLSIGDSTLVNVSVGFGDGFLIDFDPSANIVWMQHIGSVFNDFVRGVAVDSHGDVLLCGFFSDMVTIGGTVLTSFGAIDGFAAKYTNEGDAIWATGWGSVDKDPAFQIGVDSARDVIVRGGIAAGAIFGDTTLAGGGTVLFKLHDPTIVGVVSPPVNGVLTLFQNYPNPFNPQTNIQYELDRGQHVELMVYDALGRPVRRLVSETQPAGVHHVRWDGSNDAGRRVASGTYFYRVRAGGSTITRKLIVIR